MISFRTNTKDRYQGVYEVLQDSGELGDLASLIRDRQVLIKPNLTSVTRQLASTHIDAVRAVLDVVSEFNPRSVIVGEASGQDTSRGFDNFGYKTVERDYGIKLVDLNHDNWEPASIYDEKGEEDRVRIAKTALISDCRISLALPKTHDTVIVTLTLKNMVMGSIVGNDKQKFHRGYRAINLNLALLGKLLMPHIGVIDGFEGMEGDGPVDGDPVPHRIALAGTDPVTLDAVTADLIGFPPQEIGYLVHAKRLGLGEIDLTKVELGGDSGEISAARRRYRPHRTYQAQKGWKLEGTRLEELLIAHS